jgi:hypothetical protein
MEDIFTPTFVLFISILSIPFLLFLLWVYSQYVYARNLKNNDFLCPKMQKRMHKEFMMKINAISKETEFKKI